jgi:hypothetical protein
VANATLGDLVSIAVAMFAFWLAWETRGLRRATLELLSATRRQTRLAIAPFIHIGITKAPSWVIHANNVSSALATEIYGFIYDASTNQYLRTSYKGHSKPGDYDEYDRWSAGLSKVEALRYLTEREANADEKSLVEIIDNCGAGHFAVMVYHDMENRLYTTRRDFKVAHDDQVALQTLSRRLVTPKQKEAQWRDRLRFWQRAPEE